MKKYINFYAVFFAIIFLITPSLNAINLNNSLVDYEENTAEVKIKNFKLTISDKEIKKYREKTNFINDSYYNSHIPEKRPYYTHTSLFPIGTNIIDVKCKSLKHNITNKWYSFRVGGGIENEKHVGIVSIYFYPIENKQKKEYYTKDINVQIRYTKPSRQNINTETINY